MAQYGVKAIILFGRVCGDCLSRPAPAKLRLKIVADDIDLPLNQSDYSQGAESGVGLQGSGRIFGRSACEG
ncbi:hypothetical protein [Pseudomonas sp. ICMP 10191]|uniref:hypothetical protein n=1 Tax=Pseudomonas sp. ICMP 10191 TaxID=1198294 RepID=UPI001F1648BF|nr:hypothetical protein [Pseudomonas sp. ICMP 10191]